MTFDDWWKQFMEKRGKPKKAQQEKLVRAFAEMAWNAGHVEGFDEAAQMVARLKPHEEGP